MPRRAVAPTSLFIALLFACTAAAQHAPAQPARFDRTSVTVAGSGVRRDRVERAFDTLRESLLGCAQGGLGTIDGDLELRVVFHADGTVVDAAVAQRPTGATAGFVLCVLGVARRMRIPGFRSHDVPVVIHARVFASH